MTKIMTSIVAFDLLKNKLSLMMNLLFQKTLGGFQAGYSSMFIMINDQVSVEDLLKE